MTDTKTEQRIDALCSEYVPVDKSHAIRMATMDFLYGDPQAALDAIGTISNPSDDIVVVRSVIEDLQAGKTKLSVGESGTVYRIYQYLAWKHDWQVELVKEGTLVGRPMPTKEEVLACASQRELLELPGVSSQWATAAVLDGSEERLNDGVPFKLQKSYDAWNEWHTLHEAGESWAPQLDATIAAQARYFLRKLAKLPVGDFMVEQAEDFPFAYTLGIMSPEEGLAKFPALVGHESNRILETPKAAHQMTRGELVGSKDHRVVQAVAMLACLQGHSVQFEHPNSVAKSWPRFWEFLAVSRQTILGDVHETV